MKTIIAFTLLLSFAAYADPMYTGTSETIKVKHDNEEVGAHLTGTSPIKGAGREYASKVKEAVLKMENDAYFTGSSSR